jgi:tetratricopeptide (TPR) repeat protein
MRAPLGLDWTQVAVVEGTTAALFRAGAWLGLALAMDPSRAALRGGPGVSWLAALAGGYAAHGFACGWTPGSRAGFALFLVVTTCALRALAARAEPALTTVDPAPARLERLGLVAIGVGAALAFESLAHEVRLFTMATSADDTMVGTALLTLVFVGAAAFGPLLARVGQESTRFAAGIACASAATIFGLLFLACLTPGGLHGYLRRFDLLFEGLRRLDEALGGRLGIAGVPPLDGASIGTAWTTALLASAAFVVPGFVLGGTLGAARTFRRLPTALAGVAAGTLLLPYAVRFTERARTAAELDHSSFAWTWVAVGAGCAALGLVLTTIGQGRSAEARPSFGGLAWAAVALALPWIHPRLALWSLSPWAASRVLPELVWPTAEGLLTVEGGRGGTRIVTLDRRRLTPLADEEDEDERRLRSAFELLAPERRTSRIPALFIGQLTPARARVLNSLGALDLECTASWYRAMPVLEEHLFGAPARAPGRGTSRVVSPAEARSKLRRGAYAWVVAMPVSGPIVTWKSEARDIWGSGEAPRLTALDLEGETIGVAWIAADSWCPRRVNLEPAILCLDRLESYSIGLLRGEPNAPRARTGPAFELEPVLPGALQFLGTMPQHRGNSLQAAWANGLVCPEDPELARGFALHFSAQHLSSPYETRAEQIEVEEEALRAFQAATKGEGPLDPLLHDVWASWAWLLTEKRLPEEIVAYLEPIAERYPPWAALDRALAQAYREMLDPATALRYLERARRQEPFDPELLLDSATCLRELGRDTEGVVLLERACELLPARPELARELGLALAAAGSERAKALLEGVLGQRPEDNEVRRALGLEPIEPDEHDDDF